MPIAYSLLLLVVCASGVGAQSALELIFPEDLNGTVKLNTVGSQMPVDDILADEHLTIYVKNELDSYHSNAIQGQYIREGDYLVFKPYFPFERGLIYIVKTKDADASYTYYSFEIKPLKRNEEASILSVYPTSTVLPENLLRFYINFNTPMRRGQALDHIKLIDEQGDVDDHAFMEFKQELWSADGKRLTLLFDPGRIKRGVSTNLRKGPALLEEKQYELRISGKWQDVFGQELGEHRTKKIEVIGAYDDHLNVDDWHVSVPKSKSCNPLVIDFGRIIDHALIQSMIKIVDCENTRLAGSWKILNNEQSAMFTPEKKWKKGNYRIIVDGRLEDVAGNNLQNLLDHVKTDADNQNLASYDIDFKI